MFPLQNFFSIKTHRSLLGHKANKKKKMVLQNSYTKIREISCLSPAVMITFWTNPQLTDLRLKTNLELEDYLPRYIADIVDGQRDV